MPGLYMLYSIDYKKSYRLSTQTQKILISETTAECSVFTILEIINIWKWLDNG